MNEIERLQKTILDSQMIIIDAKYKLGCCYYKGEGVEQDFEQAFNYWNEAAYLGHIKAIYGVGCCYHNGKGVKKNIDKALKYCKIAADAGCVSAQNILEKRKK